MGFFMLLLNSLAVAGNKCAIKNYSQRTERIQSSMGIYMIINYIVGLFFYAAMSGFKLSVNGLTLIFALIFAAVVLGLTSSEVMSVKKADIVTAVVFSGCGRVVIPFVFGLIFLKEEVTIFKCIAVAILIAVILMPLFGREHKTEKSKRSAYLWCLLFMLFSGLATVVSKVYVDQSGVKPESVFCFWTNVFLVPYVLVSNIRKNGARQMYSDIKIIDKKICVTLFVSAILVNSGTLLCMLALKSLTVATYAIFDTSFEMLLSATLSWLVYKEKLTLQNTLGIVGSVVAVALTTI